jgi:hypothetical protein
MANRKIPAVVAELGRPETPEETAARKAENSRLYRQRKTVNNLVFSLLVCVGLMFAFVMLVPEGKGNFTERDVNVAKLAQDAESTAGLPLAQPEVADSWQAKQAELRFAKDDQTTFWYIGYTTPDDYAAVAQGFTAELKPAGEHWIATQLESKSATGTKNIGGVQWTVYDHHTDSPDNSNVLYGLETKIDNSSLIVSGTASPKHIDQLAAKTLASFDQ